MILCGREWAVNTTLVSVGMFASLAFKSAATNWTKAGSVAQLCTPVTVMS